MIQIHFEPLPKLNLFDRATFWRMLNFNYWTIRASEDLLLLAAKLTDDMEYAEYLAKHLEEEKGHADALEQDLIALRCQPAVDMEATAVAGMGYYWIRNLSPYLLLPYMYALESRPMDLDAVEQLEDHYGTGCLMLRHHCEHDPGHAKGIIEQMEKSLYKNDPYAEPELYNLFAQSVDGLIGGKLEYLAQLPDEHEIIYNS